MVACIAFWIGIFELLPTFEINWGFTLRSIIALGVSNRTLLTISWLLQFALVNSRISVRSISFKALGIVCSRCSKTLEAKIARIIVWTSGRLRTTHTPVSTRRSLSCEVYTWLLIQGQIESRFANRAFISISCRRRIRSTHIYKFSPSSAFYITNSGCTIWSNFCFCSCICLMVARSTYTFVIITR